MTGSADAPRGAAAVNFSIDALDFAKGGGRVTVVAQDATTGVVLMVAAADREAVECTVRTGEMHYTSRSRGLWHKGATSGNVQRVVSLHADCDGDALLARVDPAGPACHTGAITCFGDGAMTPDVVAQVDATIATRADALRNAVPLEGIAEVEGRPSYTQRLLGDRNLRLKKLGEESAELVAACADGDAPRAVEEAADLLYHALVAVRAVGGSLADMRRVLA
ncbi:MAG: phosphoribosyl-ATP diphosphatase, partial [Gemmatimonadaceae bacterium]|nr:phosphoribosyl-ATP diphosphatase [Gemmatimonadaceae bacterium]